MLVVHRSQPLVDILRRFNCYSNNDIERVAASVGPVDDLAAFVAERCGVPRETVAACRPPRASVRTASRRG